jgi:glycosyltransferase involved in cell wall biosynthesis
MKLLYLHDIDITSGKANAVQVLQMCRSFARLGVDVTLAVPMHKDASTETINRCAAEQIGSEIDYKIIGYRKLTFRGRFTMVGGLLGAKRLLAEQKADYCFTRNPVYAGSIIQAGFPLIYEAHNATIHKNNLLNFFFKQRLLGCANSDKMTAFIAISEALASSWRKQGVPKDKVLALHDGVAVEDFIKSEKKSVLRQRLNLPVQGEIVAYTGSLYKDREISTIIKLAKDEPQALFVLVGGPDKNIPELQREAFDRRVQNIIFIGRVAYPKVKDYLHAADVLLMVWSRNVPTIDYCSPLKMFEYMAAGKTIVGHAFPTILEVLKDNETALLADPDSYDVLRMKMNYALKSSEDNTLGNAAKKLAFEFYSWDARAKHILSFIEGR